MRRILIALLLPLLLTGWTACGDKSGSGGSSTGPTPNVTITCLTRIGDTVVLNHRLAKVTAVERVGHVRRVTLAQSAGGGGGGVGDTTIIIDVNCPTDSGNTTNPPKATS